MLKNTETIICFILFPDQFLASQDNPSASTANPSFRVPKICVPHKCLVSNSWLIWAISYLRMRAESARNGRLLLGSYVHITTVPVWKYI